MINANNNKMKKHLQFISGTLPDGRWLAHPVTVLVEYDDGEFVVSEPHFHMHASASTEAEAVEAFRRIFSGYLDVLEAEEETLSPRLREQLQYCQKDHKFAISDS